MIPNNPIISRNEFPDVLSQMPPTNEPITSVDGVVSLVRSWIASARLKEGDRLPTERALSDQFNINRNLVRRAFLQLDRMGLINRHVGRGTFVGASPKIQPSGPQMSLAPDYSPAHILQARLMVEPRIAALACGNATQADLKTLRQTIADSASVASREKLEMLGVQFTEALAAAGHNPLVTLLVQQISIARRSLLLNRTDRFLITDEERAAFNDEHNAIYDAIAGRDPQVAVDVVRKTLLQKTRTFSLLARMELLPDEE